MKKRLAKKIMDRIFYFKNWDSNYLPYSREQQKKAVKQHVKDIRQKLAICVWNRYRSIKCH